MIPAVLALLAEKGLSLISSAVIAKGKSVIEDKLGIKLPSTAEELTPELTAKLLEVQNAHEEFLITAALEEKKVEAASQAAASTEVTARWQADMGSDNKLSKNIRPAVLIFLLLLFTGFAIASIKKVNIDVAYVSLLGELLKMVFTAYFVGRTVEKSIDMLAKTKKDK